MQKQRIALICDDERLLKIIPLAFDKRQYEMIVCNYPGQLLHGEVPEIRLLSMVIIALALPMSEPIVELSRAQLGGVIGKLPILIVSQHAFHPARSQMIYQMDFPFDINELKTKVESVLSENKNLIVLEEKQTNQSVKENARQ